LIDKLSPSDFEIGMMINNMINVIVSRFASSQP